MSTRRSGLAGMGGGFTSLDTRLRSEAGSRRVGVALEHRLPSRPCRPVDRRDGHAGNRNRKQSYYPPGRNCPAALSGGHASLPAVPLGTPTDHLTIAAMARNPASHLPPLRYASRHSSPVPCRQERRAHDPIPNIAAAHSCGDPALTVHSVAAGGHRLLRQEASRLSA